MAENMDNLVLEHLRALRSDIQTLRTEMHFEFKDVKHRLSSLEVAMSSVKRDQAETMADYARQQMSRSFGDRSFGDSVLNSWTN